MPVSPGTIATACSDLRSSRSQSDFGPAGAEQGPSDRHACSLLPPPATRATQLPVFIGTRIVMHDRGPGAAADGGGRATAVNARRTGSWKAEVAAWLRFPNEDTPPERGASKRSVAMRSRLHLARALTALHGIPTRSWPSAASIDPSDKEAREAPAARSTRPGRSARRRGSRLRRRRANRRRPWLPAAFRGPRA